MKILMTAFVALLAFASSASAQAANPVNPSTLSFIAPTTNPDGTALNDLAKYNIRVAGPSATAPSYSLTAYPIKATMTSPTTTPAPNTALMFGTPNSGNLAGSLGLAVDGQYWPVATAVDIAGNESAPSGAAPFVRNAAAPSAPSGLTANP